MKNLFKKFSIVFVSTLLFAGLMLMSVPHVNALISKVPVPIALYEDSLQSAITSTATAFNLVRGTDITGTSLAANTYGFIIDEGSATQEFVLADCTATVCTNALRGVSPITGLTSVTSLKKAHRRGAVVKITDAPILLVLKRLLNGDETIPNKLSYVSHPLITSNQDIPDKQYVDFTATGTATYASNVISGTAGAALVAGNAVYFKTSDQKWYPTDATSTATFRDVRVGISQTTGSGTVNILISGLDATQTGLTPGARYYLSNTSGQIIANTSQTNVVFIGWAVSATELLVGYRFDTAGSPYLFSSQYASLRAVTTTTLDWNAGNVQSIVLANGGQTFTFANPQDGGRYMLLLEQPGSGAAGTITWPATVTWSGGVAPTLTATNSKVDIVSMVYDATANKFYAATSYNF